MNTRSFFQMPWFLLALFFLFAQHSGWAQNQLNMDLLAHWPEGTVEDIQIVDDELYYADGSTFVISDVSDPTQPTMQGSYTFNVSILALLINDHLAYIVDGFETMYILDISDDMQPQFIQSVSIPGDNITDIEKRGDYVYMAQREGLTIVDVRNSMSPNVVNHTFEDNWLQDLFIDDSTLFVVDRIFGLRIYSLKDPVQPTEISSFEIDQSSYSIDKRDDYLFVTDDSEGTFIFDVSDLNAPSMINKIDGPITHSAVIVDSILFCSRGKVLDIYNVVDLLNPQRLSVTEMNFGIEKIRWSDDHLYMTSYDQDLYIFNVIDGQNPSLVSSISTGGITRDIFVQDQLAYVANSNYGLRIIDIHDLTSPVELSLTYTGDIAEQILVQGQIAFIANYFDGLTTIDVSDPSSPVILDELDTRWAEDMDIRDEYIFIADRYEGLVIVDISDPANLSKASALKIGTNVVGLDVDGDYAYMAAHSAGLFIIDISNPFLPTEVGHLEGNIWEVIVVDQYAYLADYTNGFRIIDISNPTLPVELGRLMLAGSVADLALIGNYAYVATLKSGVRMLDIRDPAHPVEHGYFQQVASTIKVSVSDEYIFSYDRNGGVYVLAGKEGTTSINQLIDPKIQFECNPNPFSVTTQISFYNIKKSYVDLRIFDQSGKLVNFIFKDELTVGEFIFNWDGTDATGNRLPAGIYFCQLKTPNGIVTKKLVRLK